MTIEEAKRIAAAAEDIDGGCGHCIGNFLDRLNKAFFEFHWWLGNEGIEVKPNDNENRA